MAGASTRTVDNFQKVHNSDDVEVKQAVMDGTISIRKGADILVTKKKTREVRENIKDLNEQEFRIDTTYKKDKSYACVVLDFPWQMGIEYDAGRFRGVGKYDTLSCLLYTSPSPRDS